MNWQQLIFLVITSFVFMLRACDDGDSKEIYYKKQCIFFPIVSSDLFPESRFRKQFAEARLLFDQLKNTIDTFEYIEHVPNHAKMFIQEYIKKFEEYYDLGLNKNYVKKVQVVLSNPLFWNFIFLISLYPIYALYYGKSLYKYAAGVLIFNSIVLMHFFYGLYPCQLLIFWEKCIAGPLNGRVVGRHMSFKNVLSWFFTHPLQSQKKRKQLIDMYENHLSATIFALKQIDQPVPIYIICPFSIFSNGFQFLTLNSIKRFEILVVSLFNKLITDYRRKKINNWFLNQGFLQMINVYCINDKRVVTEYQGSCGKSHSTSTLTLMEQPDNLKKSLDQCINKSIKAVIYINSYGDFAALDKMVYESAYSKKANLIHCFNDSILPGQFESLDQNNRIFDQPFSKVL